MNTFKGWEMVQATAQLYAMNMLPHGIGRLDIFRLRDQSLEDPDNLPDPDVLAREIVEDLDAALGWFREIAENLGAGESSGQSA